MQQRARCSLKNNRRESPCCRQHVHYTTPGTGKYLADSATTCDYYKLGSHCHVSAKAVPSQGTAHLWQVAYHRYGFGGYVTNCHVAAKVSVVTDNGKWPRCSCLLEGEKAVLSPLFPVCRKERSQGTTKADRAPRLLAIVRAVGPSPSNQDPPVLPCSSEPFPRELLRRSRLQWIQTRL